MFCTSLTITLLKCPGRNSKTFYPPWQRGTGVSQGLSGHIMLNCSNWRFCVVLWQQKGELDQLQKRFPSPGLPFQPQIILKKPLFGVVWGSTVALPDSGRCCLSFREFLLLF